MTLSVADAAREHPGGLALVTDTEKISWAELARRVADRARSLPARPGEPSLFLASATTEAVVELLAILERGAVAAPIHPRWGPAERDALRAATDGLRDDRLAVVVRTSGTSGRARFAALSRDALVRAANASAARLGWTADDRWLLSLPFAHVGGLGVIVRCLLARRAIVLGTDRFEDVTIASVVPTQLARMLQRNMRAPGILRVLLVGGAACPPSLAARARGLGWPVRLTYGLTETCAQFATQRLGDPDDTVGPPLDGYEARVSEGVLEVRSPALLTGFLDPGAIAPATGADGWYRTGDLAQLEGGLLRILGRADDVIVTGGEKVIPGEVERALGDDAVVVGRADAEWGQVVCAVMLHRNMSEATRALAAARERLPGYAVPRFIALADELPLNANGKIDRRAIAAWPEERWVRAA